MFILSAGMQKSGSAYFYNILNELEIAAGNKDARQVRAERGLGDLMKWHNNNIGELSLLKLVKLYRISLQEGTFVVKTHSGPNQVTRILSRLGLVKIVYCYRDPRDVLLSAIDHGREILAGGEFHTFANMVDFEKALHRVARWLRIWKRYTGMSKVLTVKYEEMMRNPVETIKQIEGFLGISVSADKRQAIIWKFSKDNPDGDRKGMHFNRAMTFRFKTEMTPEQKARCHAAFGKYLVDMNYEND